MAIFNPEFFTNPAASLSTKYGIPTCIVELSVGALNLLSEDMLGQVASAAQKGQQNARSAISNIFQDTFTKWGIM